MALSPERIKEIDQMLIDIGLEPPKPKTDVMLSDDFRETIRLRAESFRQQEARGGEETSFRNLPGNILPSAGRAARDIGGAIAGLSPVGKDEEGEFGLRVPPTLKALFGVTTGAVQKLIPGEQANEAQADAVGQFFKDRYGSIDAAKQTIINDPIGAALDIATAFTAGGGAAAKAGKIANVAKLEKAGQVAQRVGRATDPILAAQKGAGVAARGIGSGVKQLEGVLTGVGPEVLKEAFRNPSRQFTKALRGETSKIDLVDAAREGLHKLKDQRAAQYQSRLQKIAKDTKEIDITPLRDKLTKEMDKFNIRRLDDGTIDFSRSTISEPTEITRIQGVIDTLQDWGSQADDLTPLGVDLLKRRLDDFFSASDQANSFVTSVKTSVKDILNKNVKGYAEMTKGYAEASQFIDEVQKSLSLGGKSGVESAINKLAQGLKENKEFRQSLIRQLDELTDVDITGRIAGGSLNTLLPRGLTGKLFAGGAIGGGAASSKLILTLLAGLPFFSPRIVGELTRALGLGAQKIKPMIEAVRILRESLPEATRTGIFQSGRIREQSEDVRESERLSEEAQQFINENQ